MSICTRKVGMLVAMALCAALCAAPLPFNGTFDGTKKGWGGPGKIDAEVKHAGTGSLLLERRYALSVGNPEIEAGSAYELSCWIKCDGCQEESVSIMAACSDGKGKWLTGWLSGEDPAMIHDDGASPALIATGGTHDWKRFSTLIGADEIPAGTRVLLLYLRRDAVATPKGKAWFDDLTVTKVDQGKLERLANQAYLKPAASLQDIGTRLAALTALAQNKATEHLVADHGTLKVGITIGNADSSCIIQAANELCQLMTQITTGKKPSSQMQFWHDACPGTGPQIIVGKDNELCRRLVPAGDFAALGTDGFIIRSVGSHVVIAGKTPGGTLNGVYWFLDRILGVRWYTDRYTFVPKYDMLELAALNLVCKPRFDYREVFAADGDDEAYRAHNLLNGCSHHRMSRPMPKMLKEACWVKGWADGGHNFHQVVPTAVYGKKHPEYYAGGQLALMNPDVRKIAADHFIRRIRRAEGYSGIPFGMSQQDCAFGLDAEGQKFANAHGGTPAAPLLDMLTDIGSRIRKVYPEVRLSTLAYQATLQPPVNMTVPDYIRVCVAPIDSDFSQPFNGPRNANHTGKAIAGWASVCHDVYIWDYITNFSAYAHPYPNVRALFRSLKYLASLPAVKGYFGQGSMCSRGAELAHLRQWVVARLLWDPDLDVESLIADYVQGVYGPAAPFVMNYIALFEKAVAREGRLFLKTELNNPIYDFATMSEADRLLSEAQRAVAGKRPYEKHLGILRIGTDAVILLKRGIFAEEAQEAGKVWDADVKNRLARVRKNIRLAGMTRYGESTGLASDMLKVMALERTTPSRPDQFKDIPEADYMEYQDLVLLLYGAKLKQDPAASDHVAAVTAGQSPTWAIQWRCDFLPPGTWDVYVEAKCELKKDADDDTDAFSFGVYPPFSNVRTMKAEDLRQEGYQLFKLPGEYINDAGRAFWAAGIKGGSAREVWVDRIIAIRKR